MTQLILNLTYPCDRVLPPVTVPDAEPVDEHRACRSAQNTITICDTFTEQNVVPDVDRYRLRLTSDRIILLPHSACEVCPCANRYNDKLPQPNPVSGYSKTVVIVLESPHVDEYRHNDEYRNGDVGQPIAPAQGTTGSNIQGWLDCVLRSCSTLCGDLEEETRVILSNPVPFQASLASIVTIPEQDATHLTPEQRRDQKREHQRQKDKMRDDVWSAIWDCDEIKDKFRDKVERYHPDIIINACTHDCECNRQMCPGNTRCKKYKMRAFLNKQFTAPSKYEVAHPVSWFSHRTLYSVATINRPTTSRST